ncbi:hypothetical protein [Streptomyces sp. NBC_00467]|uniref:hypothetical protein n=1 Tax=Streptomyces sp. NBC_00467 TaxID=2975752 RepID=UPI002E17E092
MPVLVTLALDQGLALLGPALGLLVALLLLAVARWRRRPVGPLLLRSFTLLRTANPDGSPVIYETTRPFGSRITVWTGDRQRPYELTEAQLADGSYAAEPLDHQ